MSRHPSREHKETLEIIKEEQRSLTNCSVEMTTENSILLTEKMNGKSQSNAGTHNKTEEEEMPQVKDCCCKQKSQLTVEKPPDTDIQKLLEEKKKELRAEFQKKLEIEINLAKDRFDFILHNEQVRSFHMLSEAHRERQEKIAALRTQLECKNMAGLMYVLCAERRKSKLEKMRLIEEYTNYIRALQDILTDGQDTILKLSRGYKTAARVDYEWKEKMTKIIEEFRAFVCHYLGGTPESTQYFFNLPELLKIEAPIEENPQEDPCEADEDDQKEKEGPVLEENKTWWERLEDDCRPFVVFGDMADFKPPQRRAVLKVVKAKQTAPAKWKEYVFNEMFVKASCPNADTIKEEVLKLYPDTSKFNCISPKEGEHDSSTCRPMSVDVRCHMGSILKIVTASVRNPAKPATNLLGARDSMEIVSCNKLQHKQEESRSTGMVVDDKENQATSDAAVMSNILLQPPSDESPVFSDIKQETFDLDEGETSEVRGSIVSTLGSKLHDSLEMIANQKRKHEHIIHFEKICPVDKCKLMQMDSFTDSLPPYMKASPFLHFEQSFEEYETCSPEQLEILKLRLEAKSNKKDLQQEKEPCPLDEWVMPTEGVAVQTSELSVNLPPCTCRAPNPTPLSSTSKCRVYDVADLFPTKEKLDEIHRSCFYDEGIQFNRFKVVGQPSDHSYQMPKKEDFAKIRLYEIKKILQKYPSLCDLFQANTKC